MTPRNQRQANGEACVRLAVAAAALLVAGCGADDAPDDIEPMEMSGAQALTLDEEMDSVSDDTIDDPQSYLLAEAEIMPVGASGVSGKLLFEQRDEMLQIRGRISGLSPGDHGLHIHETGDCSGPGAASAGGHFSPADDPHGTPYEPDARHHAGDLGNITADDDGDANIELLIAELTLGQGSLSIMDRAVVVHAGADDLTTQPAGDAGARAGCAVIKPVLQPEYVPR